TASAATDVAETSSALVRSATSVMPKGAGQFPAWNTWMPPCHAVRTRIKPTATTSKAETMLTPLCQARRRGAKSKTAPVSRGNTTGARIFLDGEDTGLTTPAVLEQLESQIVV